jgi:hypothetical protein
MLIIQQRKSELVCVCHDSKHLNVDLTSPLTRILYTTKIAQRLGDCRRAKPCLLGLYDNQNVLQIRLKSSIAEHIVCTARHIPCIIANLHPNIHKLSIDVNLCSHLEDLVGLAVIEVAETVTKEEVDDYLAKGLTTELVVVCR